MGGGNLLHGLFQEGYTSENIAFYIGKMVIAENRQLWINCFLSQQANAELGAVWSVGQRIWQRDFPGIYTTISAHQWSETIQPIMEALRDATRRRAFGLVSQAYTSIVADDFAAFVGLPVEEAVKGVLEQGWQADFSTRMVMPKKPGALEASFNRFIPSSEPAPVPPIPNEQQLARLTDYVAFLEN